MHQQRWLTHVNQTKSFVCVDSMHTCQSEVSPIPLDDLTFVGFGDCGWGLCRDGSSQGGSLILAADKRILDGFEATTTMVDWKSYKFTLCFWIFGKA